MADDPDDTQQAAGNGELQSGEQDDWLVGTTIGAQREQMEVQAQYALSDLNLPHPDQWGESGTAYA